VTGCYHYTPIEPGEVGHYGKVRVWTIDGEREVISDPRIEADSLMGKDVSAIALIQVAEIEAMSTNVEGTVIAVGSIVVAAVAVGYVVAHLVTCSEGDLYC
jgi:hypothetical protein